MCVEKDREDLFYFLNECQRERKSGYKPCYYNGQYTANMLCIVHDIFFWHENKSTCQLVSCSGTDGAPRDEVPVSVDFRFVQSQLFFLSI